MPNLSGLKSNSPEFKIILAIYEWSREEADAIITALSQCHDFDTLLALDIGRSYQLFDNRYALSQNFFTHVRNSTALAPIFKHMPAPEIDSWRRRAVRAVHHRLYRFARARSRQHGFAN